MKRILFIFSILILPHSNCLAQGDILKAGVAQLNITPSVGYPHYRNFGTAVHDSLYVKAIVFRQGALAWAIAVCDLLWIERSLSSEVRMRVSEKTGIPFDNILITATHTHTGPAYHPNIYELNDHLRKFDGTVEDAISKDRYPTLLADRISQALTTAFDSAVPVRIRSYSDTLIDLSFNRRFIMQDGKVRTNPGRGNREIVKTAGPVDPELNILRIEKQSDGALIAVVSNFAVHSDTFGGTAFSADYPGVLAKALAEKFGRNIVSIFLMGASGDINHLDVRKDGVVLTTEIIGRRLAEKIGANLNQEGEGVRPRLDASAEFVYAPLQAYSEEEIQWAKDRQAPAKYGETGLFQLRRPMKIRSLERIRATEAIPPTINTEPWTLPVEVQVFKLSEEIAVVGLPGEIFAELGLSIKRISPFRTTLIVELTNSHIAYVPTQKAFTQGSYEVLNSRLAPGGGELMVQAAAMLLKELKKE